jgi:hypothetical protein
MATTGTRLQVAESHGLGRAPLKPARSAPRQTGWRMLRGAAKRTNALKEHLAEHRREAKRIRSRDRRRVRRDTPHR